MHSVSLQARRFVGVYSATCGCHDNMYVRTYAESRRGRPYDSLYSTSSAQLLYIPPASAPNAVDKHVTLSPDKDRQL